MGILKDEDCMGDELALGARDAISLEARLSQLEAKVEDLGKEADRAKREYVTILGIFAAIVMAFTAGIAFSSSALENIGQASPAKMGIVLIPMAWFLLNMIALLIYFLISVIDAKKLAVTVVVGSMDLILVAGFVILVIFAS